MTLNAIRELHGPPATRTNPPMTQEINPGDLLDDRFEITQLISRSGMASISKAVDRQNGELVAVKIPFMQYESDPAFHARFEREEEIGLSLNHPSLLRIRKVDKAARSRPYIVMELLIGRTLEQTMRNGGPMELDRAVQIAGMICDALDHMHSKGVVHRDLKPQNIMICQDGSLRIMDFGIAKAAGMKRLTFVGFSPTMGTPDYMAPEQVKGRRGDERTDIYSLGAILYEMATGNIPFEGDNPFMIMHARVTGDPKAPRSVNPLISMRLQEIILHAMERDPLKRFGSASEMKAELDDPAKVDVTHRHTRLVEPNAAKSWWSAYGLYIVLAAMVPVSTVIAIILTHRR